MTEFNTDTKNIAKNPDSPDDVVQVAYCMKMASDYMRAADAALKQTLDALDVVRDRVVDGRPFRHMDFGPLYQDIHNLRGLMFEITHAQQAQCQFNVDVLGNKPVTQDQLDELGGGGCR